MRMTAFSRRNLKEILRDPLNLGFGLGFPLVLLFLMSAIQSNIPVELFEINRLAPGVAVFGLAFITLFTALLIAKDRESSFLVRLYTTPMSACDYIIGYMLPLVPIAIGQSVICYMAAVLLGLELTVNIVYAVLIMIPISLLYIASGLLFGSIFSVKQAGTISGALFTNLAAWLSGVWFDLNLVGGVFKDIAYALPFVHAVEIEKAVIAGSFDDIFTHIIWVMGYTVALIVVSILVFLRQMKKQ